MIIKSYQSLLGIVISKFYIIYNDFINLTANPNETHLNSHAESWLYSGLGKLNVEQN